MQCPKHPQIQMVWNVDYVDYHPTKEYSKKLICPLCTAMARAKIAEAKANHTNGKLERKWKEVRRRAMKKLYRLRIKGIKRFRSKLISPKRGGYPSSQDEK